MSAIYLALILSLFSFGALTDCKIIDVTDYWPEVKQDLTKVIWSHATNSQNKLQKALEDETMMIEADVNLGYFTGGSIFDFIPIMAHPPIIYSDLSLDLFLDKVIEALKSNSTLKKGIKLDFKRTDILEESLQILTAKLDLINFPLWINADIIDGPGLNLISNKIVNADIFLALANKYAPMATVSPGFTTSAFGYAYTLDQMNAMIESLITNNYFGVDKSITFPIRAIYAAPSQRAIEYLLDSTDSLTTGINSTLTIWGTDDITNEELEALKSFINYIGKHRTYVDTAYDLNGNNQQKRNSNVVVKKESKSFTVVMMDILSLLFSKFQ